jgi:hypothetical protein
VLHPPAFISSFYDFTLVAFQLKALTKTFKRKAISRSKLYLFDIGVTNLLANKGEFMEGSELFGNAFERFILLL